VVVRAIEIVAQKGHKPPVLLSGNIKAGGEYNKKYKEKYRFRIRHYQ
jgi:uncharacterized phosphosugar-binding protein